MSIVGFGKKIKSLTKQNVLVLVVIVIVASSLLIFINYYTIRIISSVRTYIHGENQYSKGQKDASRFLTLYINTEDPEFWDKFQNAIQVPIGDSLARVALTNNDSYETIKQGFLIGRNHPDDLDDMIWLFQNFRDVTFMKQSIQIWKEADVLVGQLHTLGKNVHNQLKADSISKESKQQIIDEINIVSAELTAKQTAFSETLGAAARTINSYMFYINFFMTLLIIGGSGTYAIVMFRQLKEKNRDLLATNAELDRFVYSASHDLRAPITSMKGLIEVASQEEISEQIKDYFHLMTQTLDKQDEFIREIIDFSRNKRTTIEIKKVSLANIINDAIIQHKYIKGKSEIKVEKNIQTDSIFGDELRLKIIINNLISNAFKYIDTNKENQNISIKTFSSDKEHFIEVADNGIGIKKENQDRIFNMFYSSQNKFSGSGLGLYITKETVQKLNGNIKVDSEVGKGSRFTIRIPLAYAK